MTKNSHQKWAATLGIIFLAAVLIELTNAVQYLFAREGIRKEAEHRAQSELYLKSLEIEKVMTAVEVAMRNHVWAVEQRLREPDAMFDAVRQVVKDNRLLVGCSIAFIPGYYAEKGELFEPYAQRTGDTITCKQIGGDRHRYTESDWYTTVITTGKPYWSEPYFDESGGEVMMVSYEMPIHDESGRVVADLGADVSLDWLADVLNVRHIYPSSYNMIVSRQGQVLVGTGDTAKHSCVREMLSGQRGQASFVDEQGEKRLVFYAPVGGDTGWSMAVVCVESEIYRDLHRMGFYLGILMLIGLAMLCYIIWRTIRSFRREQQVNAEKERIGSELRIARNIQMAMLPKTFPPYPDRNDIDIYGQLTPAKEVGGDLYDFYIRDEKLFFCIGDVSGKGVPASLVMAVTRALFRNISAHESQPDRIVTQLNDTIAEDNDSNMFVTMFVGVLDLPTGRLRYTNAGHVAPVIISERLRVGEPCPGMTFAAALLPVDSNLPVGVMSGWKFTSQETTIDFGTSIFLYTDGLTEAENTGHELFGEKRMLETISVETSRCDVSTGNPRSFIGHIMEAVHTFVGEAEPSDDLTMLAIRYTRPKLASTLQRSITLSSDVEEIPQLAQFVDEVCEAVGFGTSPTMSMNLAIEEAVVNVMEYAYPKGTKGYVSIEAVANAERLKFIISDSGTPFDPTAKGEVDTTLSAEERPIGGLGIHLVRQIMDSINYERIDGKNVLTLRKRLKR